MRQARCHTRGLMIAERIPEIAELTREEKRELVAELWEEVLADDDSPTDEAIERLIKARMANYEQNPDAAMTWNEFRSRWGLEQ